MRNHRLAVSLVGTIVALGACTGDDPTDSPADAAIGVRATGCGLVDSLGTGAVISSDDRTLIVTSAHTVAGSHTITVERGRSSAAVELVALDPERDLAVLTAPGWSDPGRVLSAPEQNAAAHLAVWNPGEEISVADTEITRLLRVTIEDIYVVGEYERRAFEVAATVVRGDSGAPVVADDGSVYGIVYARSRERDGVAFAVSSVEIDDLLSRTGVAAVDSGRCA